MLDENYLEKIRERFDAYKFELHRDVDLKEQPYIAAIATVMDLVREDLEESKTMHQLNKETMPIVPISISAFLPQDKLIYLALYSLGCENLIDITGWRRGRFGGNMPVFEIRVKGRYATMPPGCIGLAEIEKIGEMMKRCDLPFEEQPMEPVT